ncbi:MAG: bifunctional UDP-sugar hydrolase/5'-nucleotidase [Thermoanaerobaculales bacterium]
MASIRMRVGLVFGAALLLLGAVGVAADGPKTAELTILHTSDLHGAVLPGNDLGRGSLIQVATLVEDIRRRAGHPVLLFDSGDTIQGSPLEQFAHVRWGEPSPTIEVMNLIGYQAMAVGNHEFNFGLDVLRRAQAHAQFPFLSANTVGVDNGEPAFQPYVVLQAGALRVGVLGLTTPNIPGWEKEENYRGLAFEAMDAAARRWVPILREKEGCDLVVVLAHTGFERNPSSGEPEGTGFDNFAWRLTEVPGIDVLLTGHTHSDMPPRRLHGVIVSQPRARAQLLTRIDLDLQRKGSGWKIVRWNGENLPTGAAVPDHELRAHFAPLNKKVETALDGAVGRVTGEVRVDRCRLVDCAALDLVHAVQLEASGAQLSLAALLNGRLPALGPGPVSWRWVHAFYTYPNTLVAVRLNGAQIVDILEHSARYYDGLRCPEEGGCSVLTDPSVPHYNVDSMAGISYRIDPTRLEGSRIRDLRFRGLPLDLHATFTLVCNSYRASGGGLYPHLAEAEVVWKSSEEMTDLIGDYLARHDPWQPVVDDNWRIGRELAAEESFSAPAPPAPDIHLEQTVE